MKKIHLSKRTIISSAAIVLVLGASLGVGIWVGYLNQQQPVRAPSNGITPLPAAVEQAQNARISGDTSKFTATVQKGLDDPSTTADVRSKLYVQLGGYYEDKSDWQNALDNYLKAAQAQESASVDKQIARMYVMVGDKTKAIDYFKKAIASWPVDDVNRDDSIDVLRNAITNLGGQP